MNKSLEDLAQDVLDYMDTIAIPPEYIGKSYNVYDICSKGQKSAFTRKWNLFNEVCKESGINPNRYMKKFTSP